VEDDHDFVMAHGSNQPPVDLAATDGPWQEGAAAWWDLVGNGIAGTEHLTFAAQTATLTGYRLGVRRRKSAAYRWETGASNVSAG
ncbi:MAG TPA: hypothetical protein VF714_02440, partial [Jatrophihabitans sp.]